MKFNEIKQKYADKEFIHVDEFSAKESAVIKKLDDFMLTDDLFLYSEDILDESDATDLVINSMLDMAKDEIRNEPLYLPKWLNEINDEYDECYDELYDLCKLRSARFLKMRSIKYNIEYSENEVQISEERKASIIKWILEKRKELAVAATAAEETKYAEVKNYVLTKKDEFNQLTSQSSKVKYIKNLQFKLSDKFDTEDFDVCSKFTQTYLEYLLDNPFEGE